MLCMTSLCFAQEETEHMTFMGIPMGIIITQFKAQLAKKNVVESPESKQYPVGQKVFKGRFSGQNSRIIVWYNERSKSVYRGKAMIERYGKESILQLLNKMEAKLDLKYGINGKTVDMFKDDYLHETKCVFYDTQNGRIDLFITGEDYTDLGRFYLHVDYYDKKSNIENTIDEMDDL